MPMSEMLGVQPIYDVKGKDGFGDNWILFLFFLLAWGGGGLGGLFGGRGQVAEAQMISNDFMYSNLNNAIGQGFNQVINQGFQTQKDMYGGFAQLANQSCNQTFELANVINAVGKDLASCCCETNRNIDNVRYDMALQFANLQAQNASCCCETNRNIDSIRYENAKNTCDIITAGNLNTRDLIANQTANTQAILDKLTAQEVQGLRDKLTAYEIQLSNQAQTANIVSLVRPYPVPAYPVCPPMPPFPPVAQ